MPLEKVPVRREPGIEARVYSGTSGAVYAASHTYLPLTLVDVRLAPDAVFEQELPTSYNGFLYPIDGEITVDGTRPQRLATGQIGWLEFDGSSTTIRLTARTNESRVMLYAGARQNVPIVTHGPFVGETHADLVRVSRAYAEGRMPRVSELGR
jgi:redox-sensitive bicupin YhaK (pirin superfamily)